MKRLCILGSTGSIGVNTLDVVGKNSDKFKVIALSTNNNIDLLEEQIHKFKPKAVVVVDEGKAKELKSRLLGTSTEVLEGSKGLENIVTYSEIDLVVNSVVGIAGLLPTYQAIMNNKSIALANKETLVAGGEIIMKLAQQKGVEIIPIDSEHCAIFQCIQKDKGISKIILTASGGPFRGRIIKELENITPEQALKHPKWNMGKKISIDSATLMNKGLEIIEARWLFNIDYENISVLVHPQSIVHSMVEYKDGSVIAQLGVTDMRGPIQYAIGYPERFELDLKLNLVEIGALTFEEPDLENFPSLDLAYRAGKIGGTMPTVLNAANEKLVELFLEKSIGFLDIAKLTEKAMESHNILKNPTIEDIILLDKDVKAQVSKIYL